VGQILEKFTLNGYCRFIPHFLVKVSNLGNEIRPLPKDGFLLQNHRIVDSDLDLLPFSKINLLYYGNMSLLNSLTLGGRF